MSYFTPTELENIGFARIGKNVLVSTLVSINHPEEISLGDNSRVDDFCVLSGKIKIGSNVFIAVHSSLVSSAGEAIIMEDFSTIAYGCRIFSSTDDYSGETLTNPTIPANFKRGFDSAVTIGRHVIIGANSVVFPGVTVAEGCSVGASSTVLKSTDPWGIYVGSPARRIKERSKELLKLEREFLNDLNGF